MPGLGKNDITLSITNTGIEIAGQKKTELQSHEGGLHRFAASYAKFYRRIPIPHDSDASKATARFEGGVLDISIPKKHIQAVRRIPIK